MRRGPLDRNKHFAPMLSRPYVSLSVGAYSCARWRHHGPQHQKRVLRDHHQRCPLSLCTTAAVTVNLRAVKELMIDTTDQNITFSPFFITKGP